MRNADSNPPTVDRPDAERIYRNHLERRRSLANQPVSRDRSISFVGYRRSGFPE